MATYAAQADIDDLYGVDLLKKIADYDRDGQPDPDVVEKGLQNADSIIDAYLSAQYTLPLGWKPDVLKTCAIDIAVYKIALGRTGRTDEMRIRYEDALKLLEKISTGKVGIGTPPDDDGNGEPDVPDPGAGTRRGRILNVSRG